jgi:hypothetical protein
MNPAHHLAQQAINQVNQVKQQINKIENPPMVVKPYQKEGRDKENIFKEAAAGRGGAK